MFIVVSYDVKTSGNGDKRLRSVAKECMKYGKRVQNSVFECILDYTQYTSLKIALSEIIDPKHDSIRIYNMGNNYRLRIDTIGMDTGTKVDSFLSI